MIFNITVRPSFATATAIVIAGGFLTPANAGSMADPVMEANPLSVAVATTAPVVSNWTGAYIGGSLGYAKIDGSFNGADLFAGSPDGASFGVHAGYNYDFGRFVVGGELQYEATDVQEGASFLKFDGIARAKVRVGYDAGAVLPYFTTGVAQAYVSNSSFAGDDNGAFAGVGIDYKYGQKIVIGAEILQNQFDDFQGTGVDLEATTASLRVSFTF